MIRVLPIIVELVMLVACLFDCMFTEKDQVRNLPRWGWVILIVILPIAGGLAWLIAGRPRRTDTPGTFADGDRGPGPERPRPSPRAPDDDPQFLASLGNGSRDHEERLRRWEAELRRREAELKEKEDKKEQ